MTRRTLRFSDVSSKKNYTTTRPTCFGKDYDPEAVECKYECPHRATCAYKFSNSAHASVPARSSGRSAPTHAASDEEPLPEVTETDAPDESFWSRLGYNMGLQSMTALIQEALFAAKSIPRKRYFDRDKEK